MLSRPIVYALMPWGGSIEWKGQKILRVCLSAKISRIWLQIHVFAPKISRICPFAFCPVFQRMPRVETRVLSSIRTTHRNYAPAHPGIRRTHMNVLRLYMHEQRAEIWLCVGALSGDDRGLTCVREELAGRFACLPPHGSDFAHLTSLKHFADVYQFRAFAPTGAKFRLLAPQAREVDLEPGSLKLAKEKRRF